MKYISQLNAFHRFCETTPLRPQSQLMWFKLMDLNNRLGWAEWIGIDNKRLMLILDMTDEKTLIRCRKQLIDNELIEYKRGRKGRPSQYKVKKIYCKNDSEYASDSENETEYTGKNTVETPVNMPVKVPVKTPAINRYIDIDKDIDKDKPSKIDFENILNFWNSHRGDMPAIKSMTDSRKRAVRSILKKQSLDELKDVILKAEQSDFLNGRVKEFRASFDWILKPANFTKILEGNYTNRNGKAGETAEDRQRAAAIDEFEADANNWFYEQETE